MPERAAASSVPSFRRLLVVAALAVAGLLAVTAVSADGTGGEAASPPARCDQVLLTNGQTLDGYVVSEDGERVVLALVSPSGGAGRMTIPRQRIREIRRGSERAAPLGEGTIRDAWSLLRSGARTVGVRRSALRRVRTGDGTAWRLEEHLAWFGRGRAPGTRIDRIETVDLALLPVALEYHEVSEGSREPGGVARFERHVVGKVKDGTWTARVATGGESTEATLLLPPGTRGRLAAREDLVRRRAAGIEPIAFFEPAETAVVSARAGFTVLDQPDGKGARYDELVWEEGGRRLVTRSGPDGPTSEEIAEGVVAVPVTEAQAKAAVAESEGADAAARAKPTEVVLPEVGIAFAVPGTAWKVERSVASATDAGPRVLARMSNPVHVSDVRVETDPDGVLAAPRVEDAEARLLERLRGVCPDLTIVEARTPHPRVPRAWRIGLRGTLRGERVRTIAVFVDRAPARVLLLLACPEVSWEGARAGLEQIVASLRIL